MVRALSERHEEIVAQQVGLAKADAGGVDGFEDLVWAFALIDGDEYEREPVADRGGQALCLQVAVVAQRSDVLEEEAVRVADGGVPGGVGGVGEHGPVGLLVLLTWHQPGPSVRGLRLRGVDQVFRVEAVKLRGLVLGSDVSQRGDGDRKGGKALLAVHDKVAEIMQWVGLGA